MKGKTTVRIRKEKPSEPDLFRANDLIKKVAEEQVRLERLLESTKQQARVIQKERDAAVDELETVARLHRDKWFRDAKTVTLSAGAFGFRNGTPSVVILPLVEDIVIDHLEKLDPKFVIRRLNKREILRHRKRVAGVPGLAIKQAKDRFFVKPDASTATGRSKKVRVK